MANKLEIRNLRVSFKTNEGTVKAVRDISLRLEEGKTLAVVGESGSGKSVTAKSIMGILAGNSIVESGEIFYDGMDLLKITEEEYHDIRGNKISMIFQDPLSSLNPIIKIGKQLTEAMLLNGKANQRSAKKEYEFKMNLLVDSMKKAGVQNVDSKVETFKKFTTDGAKIEEPYNMALQNIEDSIEEIDEILTDGKLSTKKEMQDQIKFYVQQLRVCKNEYLIKDNNSEFDGLISEIEQIGKSYNDAKTDHAKFEAPLKKLKAILEKAYGFEKLDFYALAYFIEKKDKSELNGLSNAKINEKCKMFMNSDFMNEFVEDAKKGLMYSHKTAVNNKEAAVKVLKSKIVLFEADKIEKSALESAAKEMISAVAHAIDKLALAKDSITYTFDSSIMSLIDRYFKGIPANEKNLKKFEKEKIKIDKIKAKGKPAHEVTPAVIVDLDLVHSEMIRTIKDIIELFESIVSAKDDADYKALATEMVEHLETQSSKIVFKVTKQMAKNRAIKMMKEVGIPLPRKRYEQFPFQFSGGMRQRIVIAIALVANPDILICDEPTTALDVTIQAQILELINELKYERNLSIIFITHDLGVVANIADEIAVMYAGKVVEQGAVDEIFYEPSHPYTWALLASMPDLETTEKLDAIPGTPPNMIHPPIGDAFADRNKYALAIDFEKQPPFFKVSDTHYAATWLLHENAPKVEPPKIVTDRIRRMKKMQEEAKNSEQ